jgi:uncharacterized DUF497 family protein
VPEDLPDIYAILARCTGFQWDAGNAPKVLARHNVEPGECEQAFFRHPFLVAFDAEHSGTELRWQALGRTLADRRLYLVFTVRDTFIRVIAARDMNQKERRRYAEAQASVEANPNL